MVKIKRPRSGGGSWMVMSPLQPFTPAEPWMRKSHWLVTHGQYGAAKEMLDKVRGTGCGLGSTHVPCLLTSNVPFRTHKGL